MKNVSTLFTVLFLFVANSILAQDIVYTVDGKLYETYLNTTNIKSLDSFAYELNGRIYRVPVSDVVVVEYEATGMEILQPDKIKKVPAVAFNDDLLTFMAKRKKVYIPYSSPHIQQRSGVLTLRNLIQNSGFYEMVKCDDEADFILQFMFDDKGRDHAYLLVTDRMGNRVLCTDNVNAQDFVPKDAGQEAAEKLFKKVFTNIIFKGVLDKKAEKEKTPKRARHYSTYFIPLKLYRTKY